MRAVRADRKLELEQEFVGCVDFGVARTPILTANLAELTRPVRQAQGLARIERGRIGTILAVVSHAGKPSARELVIARDIETGAVLLTSRLLPATPHNF